MIPIKQIYFDLDDVLNSYTATARWWLSGRVEHTTDLSFWPSDCGHDLLRGLGVSATEFHEHAYLIQNAAQPIPDLNKVVDLACHLVGTRNVSVATQLLEGCSDAKHYWVRRNVKKHVDIHITTDKAGLASPGRVLFDDKASTIESWTAAGGLGVLVPKPWNNPDWAPGDDDGFIKEFLERLI